MTRWFPIAPGTTLPAAPAAVAGQITATKTVPVWNETVLVAALSRTRLEITGIPYNLSLTAQPAPLVTRSRIQATPVAPVTTIAASALPPAIRTGAAIAVPSSTIELTAIAPTLPLAAIIEASAANLSLATLAPENAGSPARVISPPSINTDLTSGLPSIAAGAAVIPPATNLAFASQAPAITIIATDPYFSNVSLLLHMEGSNGSTTFTDSSTNGFTMTAGGSAQITTSQSKYGSGTAIFNRLTNDSVQSPSSSAFTFGTGNFTIEFWFNIHEHVATDRTLCAFSTNSYVRISADRWINFVSESFIAAGSLSRITTGQWYHLAVCRGSGSTRLFIDGAQQGSTYTDGTDYKGTFFRLGRRLNGQDDLTGLIDEVRVTKGVARYTADFTTPAAAFPDS